MNFASIWQIRWKLSKPLLMCRHGQLWIKARYLLVDSRRIIITYLQLQLKICALLVERTVQLLIIVNLVFSPAIILSRFSSRSLRTWFLFWTSSFSLTYFSISSLTFEMMSCLTRRRSIISCITLSHLWLICSFSYLSFSAWSNRVSWKSWEFFIWLFFLASFAFNSSISWYALATSFIMSILLLSSESSASLLTWIVLSWWQIVALLMIIKRRQSAILFFLIGEKDLIYFLRNTFETFVFFFFINILCLDVVIS